jgi:hypothetical protein
MEDSCNFRAGSLCVVAGCFHFIYLRLRREIPQEGVVMSPWSIKIKVVYAYFIGGLDPLFLASM